MSNLSVNHLLGIKYITKNDIELILDTATNFKEVINRPIKKVPSLRDLTVANLFFENSTRTRFSFEVAQRRLGLHVLNFSPTASSVQKGESISDTVKTFEAMGIDAAVVRLKPEGVLHKLVEHTKIPLINAGDGNHEHPTQALLDLYTLSRHFGSLAGLRVAIIGDIQHSRVARSNVWALQTMGAHVVFCAPPTMRATTFDADVPYVTVDEAIQSDVIMMLRVQLERHEGDVFSTREAYREAYGLTTARFAKAPAHTVILHPAPVNRDVEIDDALVECAQSLIFTQMKHGVPTRMAVLERALSLT
jgi:aspartate carbamoyltransferase catalytic subunit